jgi:hypothetical protein
MLCGVVDVEKILKGRDQWWSVNSVKGRSRVACVINSHGYLEWR